MGVVLGSMIPVSLRQLAGWLQSLILGCPSDFIGRGEGDFFSKGCRWRAMG